MATVRQFSIVRPGSMLDTFNEFVRQYETPLWWLAALSVATFVATLAALPFLVVRIPHDYFTTKKRHPPPFAEQHPAVRTTLLVLKNLLGAIFVIAGIVMCVIPGQGVLTIVIGLTLIDFPGKYLLERWLIRRRSVSRAINWMRKRSGHPPLEIPAAGDPPPEE